MIRAASTTVVTVALLLLCSCTSTPDGRVPAAAADGDYALGHRLLTGNGIPADRPAAVAHFRRAAAAGNAKAQAALAACYQFGLGIPKDMDKALPLYVQATLQGHEASAAALLQWAQEESSLPRIEHRFAPLVQAHLALFELYLAARCLSEPGADSLHRRNAITYLRYAALDGSETAAHLLALCYREGIGVRPSPSLAQGWENFSAE